MATSGAGLLSTDSEAPTMTEPTMSPHFPKPLQGFAHFVIEEIRIDMGSFAIFDIFFPVHKPGRHELQRILNDSDELVDLFAGKFSSTLVEIHFSFLAHHICEPTADTTDLSDCERNLVTSIDIGVEDTQNVLELVLWENERHCFPIAHGRLTGSSSCHGSPVHHGSKDNRARNTGQHTDEPIGRFL